MQKNVLVKFFGVMAAAVLVGAGCEKPVTQTNAPTNTPTNAPVAVVQENANVTPQPAEKNYTLAEVAVHADASSCWSAINGNVYDLTSWIGRHPGGADRILSICGKDGTAIFNNQHDGAPRQANILVGFKIGIVAK